MSARESSSAAAALGQVVGERRINRGLSTRALAAAAGISLDQLALIERGDGKAQLYTAVLRLAKVFEMTSTELILEADCRDVLRIAQRAIVLHLLDEQHPRPWTQRATAGKPRHRAGNPRQGT